MYESVEINKFQRGCKPTLSKGMPYFFRMEGEIRVILCRRNASHTLKLLGKKPDKNVRIDRHTIRHRAANKNGK